MGNSNTKRSDDYSSHSRRKKSKEFIDQRINYGSLVTHGIYTAQPEYDIDVVREFILKKKLSPFYKGMEDYSDNPFPSSATSTPDNLTIPSTQPYEPTLSIASSTENNDDTGSQCSKTRVSRKGSLDSSRRRSRHSSFSSMKNRRGSYKSDVDDASTSSSPITPDSHQNSLKVEPEHPLYSKEEFFKYPIECPICFLYYPRNINYTRCCDQPICTECFIQIKRTFQNPEPTCCPYCVQSNFGVTYLSPDSEEYYEQYNILVKSKEEHDPEYEKLLSQGSTPGKKRKNSISYTDPHIVSTDDIYPGWMLKYEQHQREQQRLEAMRVRNFNVQVNNNAALALLDAFFQLPIENQNSHSHSRSHPHSHSHSNTNSSSNRQHRNHTLQTFGNDLEELMLLEAIRRSLADENNNNNNNQSEEQGNLNAIEESNEVVVLNDDEHDNTSNISIRNELEEATEHIINLNLSSSNEDHTTVENTIDNATTTTSATNNNNNNNNTSTQ
ncbi:hypothetical protein BCR36DRAFT_336354 [Piromyces finnis]|uniref:RING-type domain-containing protein n=1 Tax=Piromyces finnis TaxID=1754191 RepID=A0A1Y1UDS3_9FUNG|nr:hypothetical protein BCR36DRAFT_365133 [Piromyces finnis]ORX43295.1 hypothetical protein BCR36DRAFT_336354 [Piromyces finnis]|eukprot:ORX36200.1 hypothetical protein BCR36DRAFT_365133 [Piromyces finnis]